MQRFSSRLVLTAIAALFLRTAVADPDSLLYFQIDDSNLKYDNGVTCTYNFATVSFTTDGENPSGSYLDLYGGDATVALGQAVASGSEAVYASLGSNPSLESQMLFEVWAFSGESAERMGYYTYMLSECSANILNGMSTATPLVITRMNSQAVPEPSSGLLVLLGAAVLALRRKRI